MIIVELTHVWQFSKIPRDVYENKDQIIWYGGGRLYPRGQCTFRIGMNVWMGWCK